MLFGGVTSGRAQVIDEDFEGGMPPGVSIVNNAVGTAAVVDDGSGGNNVLRLTEDIDGQASWAWFPDQFDLANKRVEIEFDIFIGRADPETPADGVSVIFQFDNDLTAVGDAGGGLGVGHLRSQSGTPREYIAVGFDIWDNGGVDPEGPVDGRHGTDGASSSHIEVNQNIDPEDEPSQATNHNIGAMAPDFIYSAQVYGSPNPTQNVGIETYDPADLIHVKILFDNRLMLVQLSGGVPADPNPDSDGDSIVDVFDRYPETTVINYASAPFPDRLSNIGFTASTGAREAYQWIDNLVVREADSAVSIVPEDPVPTLAINCGGPELDATGEIGVLFKADRMLGDEVSRTGDIATGLTITTAGFGRVTGNNVTVYARPVDVSQIPGAGSATEPLFHTNRWDNGPIEYRGTVPAGRYGVSLYLAEDCGCGVNGLGQGTKIVNVLLNGEVVLENWSAAAAAGSATGSGDPLEPCTAVLDTAIRRDFEVDVPDEGGGNGTLSILMEDLGSSNPPENATLNGLSYNRIGDPTGAGASGDIELVALVESEPAASVHLDTDFEDDVEVECPAGWTCNSNNFSPRVIFNSDSGDQRLRVTDDLTGSTAATAWYNTPVDAARFSLTAEFDVFMANPDGGGNPAAGGAEAADGAAFLVMQGTNTSALGGGGGSIGIPGGQGFTVEFDTWDNGCCGDTSGFNTANTWTHVGINDLSINSVITNSDFDPNLIPVSAGGTGWPDFFHPDGVHVRVEYDAGQVTVSLSGTTEDGSPFGPQVVAEGSVFPILGTEALVGFAGGTGGRTQTSEFDNVVITAEESAPDPDDPLAQALASARERWDSGRGELYVNAGGPTLFCTATQEPTSIFGAAPGTGDPVVWVGDQAGGGSLSAATNEFFSVTPLPNENLTNGGLQVAGTNMGRWDARGTAPGVDDNDLIFHTERYNDMEYEIPVQAGRRYDVTLYFANSFSGTAGTARRFFHVLINDEEKEGDDVVFPGEFPHCPNSGLHPLLGPRPNPVFGYPNLWDPVDAAEQHYSADPCNFAECADNGVGVIDDPDADRIQAPFECGNAAAAGLRYTGVEALPAGGGGGPVITIALTEPAVASLGEPASPDSNPKISGISIVCTNCPVGIGFVRGDVDQSGVVNLTDGVQVLLHLFNAAGLPAPLRCLDAADADDSGGLNLTDGVSVFLFLFRGGSVPAPSPEATGTTTAADPADCGPDPTDDTVECATPPEYCQ